MPARRGFGAMRYIIWDRREVFCAAWIMKHEALKIQIRNVRDNRPKGTQLRTIVLFSWWKRTKRSRLGILIDPLRLCAWTGQAVPLHSTSTPRSGGLRDLRVPRLRIPRPLAFWFNDARHCERGRSRWKETLNTKTSNVSSAELNSKRFEFRASRFLG